MPVFSLATFLIQIPSNLRTRGGTWVNYYPLHRKHVTILWQLSELQWSKESGWMMGEKIFSYSKKDCVPASRSIFLCNTFSRKFSIWYRQHWAPSVLNELIPADHFCVLNVKSQLEIIYIGFGIVLKLLISNKSWIQFWNIIAEKI